MILELIIYAIMLLVKIILLPIDLLISTFIPDVSNALNDAGEFIVYLGQGLGWAISAAGIPFTAISLIATYYIIKLTLPLNFYMLKLGIKWYKTIKG